MPDLIEINMSLREALERIRAVAAFAPQDKVILEIVNNVMPEHYLSYSPDVREKP